MGKARSNSDKLVSVPGKASATSNNRTCGLAARFAAANGERFAASETCSARSSIRAAIVKYAAKAPTGAHLTIRSSRVRFAASFMRYRVTHRSAATQPGLTQVLDASRRSLVAQDNFKLWARRTFAVQRGSVAYITSIDAKGDEGIGTAFHVGNGVFVTARHVVEGREVKEVGFDDVSILYALNNLAVLSKSATLPDISITSGPFFHSDPKIDIACFTLSVTPESHITLGGHLDDLLGQYELVLFRTLALGYPPIPLSKRPTLFASSGEVNALVDLYGGTKHPHFLISSMARGGFSGGPVMVAYDEDNENGGTALLGIVTQSLVKDANSTETGYFAVLTVEPIYDCLEENQLLPDFQRIAGGV